MISIYIIAVIITATALVMLGRIVVRRIRYLRRSQHLAKQRMQLLRRLLNLVYDYGYNPELFVKKFRKEVNINNLKYCDVICNYSELKQFDSMTAPQENPLKNTEALLYILQNKGFTVQELSVIFGSANCNAMYVRSFRVRQKCKELKIEEPLPINQGSESRIAEVEAKRRNYG